MAHRGQNDAKRDEDDVQEYRLPGVEADGPILIVGSQNKKNDAGDES
jgi:hypothetical protein